MVSLPGLGSGLDIDSIVKKLMEVEQQPLVKLGRNEAVQQAQISAYGSVKGALSTFQTSIKGLVNTDLFTGLKGTLTDSSIASVTTTPSAAAGNHQIEIMSLAQAQKIKSETFALPTTTVGGGKIKIEFGTYNPDGTFTGNPSKTKTVEIDSSHSTLADIRTAINNEKVGVTASIVNDGGGNRLVITSNNTGLENSLKITTEDDDSNNTDNLGLSRLAYDATTGGTLNMTETVAAQNATMKIDGILISKSSNTVTNALEGVTFNLLKTSSPGSTTGLNIGQETSKIQTVVNAFVTAYNDLDKVIRDATQYDAKNNISSTLTGDATVRTVQAQLRNTLGSVLSNSSIQFNSLSEIGISFQKDGTLRLDGGKLNSALGNSSKDVAELFSNNGVIGKIDGIIDGMLKKKGLIDSRLDGINTTIKSIGQQRESILNRLENVEKRYRSQFTALDTMISSMNQTSSFLQQQLANLPKSGS